MRYLLIILLFACFGANAQPWKHYASDFRHYHYLWGDTLKQTYNLAYNATTWNGNLGVPTMDAVRDKIESLSGLGYSVYTALLTQSGTGDPTATVLGTNTIGSIVWTRSSTGIYAGTLTGAFTSNKTWVICQKGDGAGSFVNALLSRFSANAVSLDVRDNAGTVTDNFTNMSIEIRVYP